MNILNNQEMSGLDRAKSESRRKASQNFNKF